MNDELVCRVIIAVELEPLKCVKWRFAEDEAIARLRRFVEELEDEKGDPEQ